MSEARDRIEEIPGDKPVYIHCRSGQRSYNIVLMLQAKGYKNIINISGGFISLRAYEYFTDTITGRKPIMDQYAFKYAEVEKILHS